MAYKHSTQFHKLVWIFCSVALLVLCCVGGVAAYIHTTSRAVDNTFTPSHVACAVSETVEGNTKLDVKIQNTGDTEAYLRATVLVNWMVKGTEGGLDHDEFLPTVPVRDTDYTIAYGDGVGTKWIQAADGFWYYTQPVMPGKATDNLIRQVVVHNPTMGDYHLTVEIVCTAIQSSPANAVQQAWNVAVAKVNEDRSLEINKWGGVK